MTLELNTYLLFSSLFTPKFAVSGRKGSRREDWKYKQRLVIGIWRDWRRLVETKRLKDVLCII